MSPLLLLNIQKSPQKESSDQDRVELGHFGALPNIAQALLHVERGVANNCS